MTHPPDMARHTRRYWLIDGLPELFMGGFFLLFSSLQFAVRFVPVSLAGFMQLLIPAVISVVVLAGRWLLHALKARTTYPHTGYVEYPTLSWWQQILGLLLGFVLSSLLIVWFFNAPLAMVALPALVGALTGLLMLFLGFYLDAPRFYLATAVSLLAGLGATLLPVDGQTGFLLVFAVLGFWLLVSGARTFRQYRRTYASQE